MNMPMNVLVIEEDPADFQMLERHLREHGPQSACRRVGSSAELDAALEEKWDVVLSDYNVPGMDFRATLQNIQSRWPDVPVILVSGSVGEETVVELLRLGLTDFILKDNPARLPAAIRRALAEAEEHLAGHGAEASLRENQASAMEEQRAARLAALSLMEDALDARARAEAAYAALRDSEKRLLMAQEGAHVGIWEWDLRDGRVYWSPEYERLYGVEPGGKHSSEDWRARVHPDDLPCIDAQWEEHIQHGRPFEVEFRIRRGDGETRWMYSKGAAQVDEAGKAIILSGINLDITERKHEEQVKATQNRLLEMVASGAALGSILNELLLDIEALAPDMLTSILTLDDGVHLRHGAAPSLPDAYIRSLENVVIGETAGSCGTAAWWREQVIVEDIETDPLWADFRDLALPHGLRACWSTPILHADGTVLGTFAVYYRERRKPQRFHLSLVELATNLASIAITRNREMQTLANERERLQLILDHAPIGIWLQNGMGKMEFVNRAFCQATGIPESRFLEVPHYAELIPETFRSQYLESDARALAHHGLTVSQHQLPFVDGRIHDLRVIRAVKRDGQGSPLALVGLSFDITEELKKSEQLRKLSLAVEQSPNCVVITDAEGVIEYVNQAYNRVSGYTADEAVGRKAGMQKSGLTPESTYAMLWTTLKAGRIWKGEFINRRKNGEIYTDSVTISPIRQEDGRISHFLSIQEDVTEKKSIGEELDRYRHHLEELVIERTSQLAAAKESAEVASRAKSAFLANMSHEIRTPMNAIVGLTYLLKRNSHDPAQQDKLDKIADAARHLLSIINDILDISKIEAGKLVLDLADFDLNDIVSNVCSLVAERAQAKGLELVVDVSPDLLRGLRGDPTRLLQALLNYAGNAIKFTERGSVVIRARAEEESEQDMLVRFEVQDTGIGIDPKDLPRLFQTFEQADVSTTRKYGGTGLGLTINRRLAELMDGQVGVTSEPGKGSLFWFTARLGKPAHPISQKVCTGMQGRRALVVDDLPEARYVLADMLRVQGMEVETADSGEAAIEAISRADAVAPYDLVLLDWRMPGLDGIATAEKLSALALRNEPFKILVTAYDEPDVHKELSEGLLSAVLVKPVTSSALYDTLIRLMGGKAPGKAGANDRIEQEMARLHGGARVLLAEDNPVNQEVAIELLGSVGLVIDVAGTGREAVEMVRQNEYDLVLMDVQMPEMDGLEATREIRSLPDRASLPIIAMTANAFGEDRARCLEAGMNDHVGKPVDPEILYQTLMAWLPARPLTDRRGLIAAESREDEAIVEILRRRIADIPGIDPSFWLDARQGRTLSYVGLLQQYANNQAEDMSNLHTRLDSGNLKDAQLLAHSLKGVAGMLGLTCVLELTEMLEEAIHERRMGDIAHILDALDDEQNSLSQAIRSLTAEPEADDPEDIQALLMSIESLLAEDNMQVNDIVQEDHARLHRIFGPRAAELERHVNNFDYEAALQVLHAIRTRAD